MKKIFYLIIAFALIFPAITFAQQTPDPLIYGPGPSGNFTPFQQSVSQNSPSYNRCYTDMDGLGDLICRVGELLNSIIPILILLGVLYMVWDIVQYFIGDNEEAKTKGKDRIIYGIVGLTVIVGLWGLVAMVVNTFDLDQQAPAINLTDFQGQGNTSSSSFCEFDQRSTFANVLNYVSCLITKSVIPLIFVIAVAAFVWGVVQYMLLGGDSDEQREKGRQFMLWGIIALAVMISVWGLVSILASTFNIDTVIPQVQSR